MCNLSTTLLIVGVITLYMCHIIYTKDVWLLVKHIILLSQKKKKYIYIYIYNIVSYKFLGEITSYHSKLYPQLHFTP